MARARFERPVISTGCRSWKISASWIGALQVLPALGIILTLFGGGLALGVIQAMGYLPAAGFDEMSLFYFKKVLFDPDFFRSLRITFAVSLTATVIAAVLGVGAALFLHRLAHATRWLHFVFQIPLTVPHLVIAVAVAFLLAPTGMISRLLLSIGLIESSGRFPLLIHDSLGIGVIVVYVWKEVPFIALMVLAVLKNTGTELIDVGKTLKAGWWQRFRYILLPTVFPALAAASLIAFAYTFGAFETPYLLGRTHPMMLPVWAYRKYSDVDFADRPEGIAAGLLIAVLVSLVAAASQWVVRAARRRGANL